MCMFILLQVQFCTVICHTTHAFFSNCPFPKRIMYLNFFYANSLLMLFINFYVRTYVMGRGGKVHTDSRNITNNGTKAISNSTSNGTGGVPLQDKKHS